MIGRTSPQATGGTHMSRYVRHSALNERPVWCAVRTTKALSPGGEFIENLLLYSKVNISNRRNLKAGKLTGVFLQRAELMLKSMLSLGSLQYLVMKSFSFSLFSKKLPVQWTKSFVLSVRINPKLLFKLSHFDSIFPMEKSHSSWKYYSLNIW